ncbi:MAG: hypothetical protein AB8B53_07315 [Flavobacteriales bacterium]
MKDILRTVEQYVVPALLLAVGIASIVVYNNAKGLETQPNEMLIGGLCLVLAGILMTPFFNKFLKKGLSLVLGLLLAGGAVALGYKVYDVIASENDHRVNKEIADAQTVQRLKDLRLAQEQYKTYNDVYAESFDQLISFLKKDVVPVPYRNGNVMEDKVFQENAEMMKKRESFIVSKDDLDSLGMTEAQAVKNHYEVRDTSYISVKKKFFSDEARTRRKLPLVNIDELPFNPHSGQRFKLESRVQQLSNISKDRKPEVYVKFSDPTPYPIDQEDRVKKDTLSFGSLDSESLDGNWRE